MLKYVYKNQAALPAYRFQLPLQKNGHYGLYGGSFNPIHKGHLAVAAYALEALPLQKIIWLVTPQNPFKDPAIYRPYAERLETVKKTATHPDFMISTLEHDIKARNTFETLCFLKKRYPQVKFTYIVGSDSLSHMHTWHFFTDIVTMVDFAIIIRPTHRFNIHGFKAISYFKRHHVRYHFFIYFYCIMYFNINLKY